VLTSILMKAASRGYISEFMKSLSSEGVLSLLYADDTLLFLSHDYVSSCHLKWLMACFDKLSGMGISYHKSDLVPVNLDEEEIQQ
jgi:hypothetical protein